MIASKLTSIGSSARRICIQEKIGLLQKWDLEKGRFFSKYRSGLKQTGTNYAISLQIIQKIYFEKRKKIRFHQFVIRVNRYNFFLGKLRETDKKFLKNGGKQRS